MGLVWFFAGWTHPKSEVLNSTEVEQNQSKENQAQHNMPEPSIILTSLNRNQPLAVPKLEDFFETETQDSSSLTQIYEHVCCGASGYFNEQQDLKAVAGFQAFSGATNSGSEVDDSATRAVPGEFGGAYSLESSGNELACSGGGGSSSKRALSLGAVAEDSDKAIVVADSDGSKKVADTFGQRTSIYRGVTR